MTHWLAHVLGMDNPSGPVYLAWSGWVGDMGLIAGAGALFYKHNCHRAWCPRIGKHMYEGTLYCARHHPDDKVGEKKS